MLNAYEKLELFKKANLLSRCAGLRGEALFMLTEDLMWELQNSVLH
jgi:hypothetical protein